MGQKGRGRRGRGGEGEEEGKEGIRTRKGQPAGQLCDGICSRSCTYGMQQW